LDLFLPALTTMVLEFKTNESTIQLNLVFNVIASAAFGFVSGILSDRWGRRRLFLLGLFGFAIGTFLCALSDNVTLFIWARMVQGACSGIIFVLVSAIISDAFSGVKKAQILGLSSFLFPIALGFAPFIGAKIFVLYGWKMTFWGLGGVVFLVGLLMLKLLPETKVSTPDSQSISQLVKDLVSSGRTLQLLTNILMPSVFMGAFIAFVAHSPFLYMNCLHLSCQSYVYFFIAPLFFQFIMGIGYQWLIKRLGTDSTLTFGLYIIACALSTLLLIFFNFIPLVSLTIMICMIFYNAAIPFVLPIAMTKAFEMFPANGGIISSLASIIRNIVMAAYVYVSSILFDSYPNSILAVLFSGGILTLGLALMSIRFSSKKRLS
jgi:MFS transporter, DHA1 family, multidrug resistance protein